MKYTILMLFLFVFSSSFINGKTFKYEYSDFYKAKVAKSFIRFDMKSTKAGLITTPFFGVVKKFELNTTDNKKLSVKFFVKEMDTDVNDRNKKMFDLCLDYQKYKTIEVRTLKEIKEGPNIVPGTIMIRGKLHKIELNLFLKNRDDKKVISGKTKVDLKELGIPDPSIWIASVDNLVEVSFSFETN